MNTRKEAKDGSIPACAGEPHRVVHAVKSHGVYPRVCGETSTTGLKGVRLLGLSPRVRGNRHAGGHQRGREGSIPACAGEPGGTSASAAPTTVYPRVCGGTPAAGLCGDRVGGLSPRVRGNRIGAKSIWRRQRSIPACAGEPPAGCDRFCWRRVYPRVCGGTEGWESRTTTEPGLSPRVRGNPYPAPPGPPPERSIPACAGEPEQNIRIRSLEKVYPRVCGGTFAIIYLS